jgi:hypothetical protein
VKKVAFGISATVGWTNVRIRLADMQKAGHCHCRQNVGEAQRVPPRGHECLDIVFDQPSRERTRPWRNIRGASSSE